MDSDNDGARDFLDTDSDNDCAPDSDPREDGGARIDSRQPSSNADANCGVGLTCDTGRGVCIPGADAGTPDAGTTPPADVYLRGGGCGCRVESAPGSDESSLPVLGALAMVAAAVTRRRRRR